MLYWIQILPPIGGAKSMDFFATHIACLIAALKRALIFFGYNVPSDVSSWAIPLAPHLT